MPLLHDQPASVDVHFAADLFSRLVNVLQQREDPELQSGLDALVSAATDRRDGPRAIVWRSVRATRRAPRRDRRADRASTPICSPRSPRRRSRRCFARTPSDCCPGRATRRRLAEGAVWQHGYCPVCGGWPSLAELRGVELAPVPALRGVRQRVALAAPGLSILRQRRLSIPSRR